jgi:hypothetical protein
MPHGLIINSQSAVTEPLFHVGALLLEDELDYLLAAVIIPLRFPQKAP